MRYDDYSVEITAEISHMTVWHEPCRDKVRRVCFWVHRRPSQKRFIVQLFADANAEDEAFVRESVQTGQIPAFWRAGENTGIAYRRRRRTDGTYEFYRGFGRFPDDPLVQLELEMILDSTIDAFTN